MCAGAPATWRTVVSSLACQKSSACWLLQQTIMTLKPWGESMRSTSSVIFAGSAIGESGRRVRGGSRRGGAEERVGDGRRRDEEKRDSKVVEGGKLGGGGGPASERTAGERRREPHPTAGWNTGGEGRF
eukprot:scaffold95367_cov31-Tisochrysis_lutea.AAC.2